MAPKKERLYEQSALEEAVQKIRTNEISLSQASSTYNIPKGTLHNKLHGKTPLVCKKGPNTILPSDEENHVATWIINMAKIGYPVTHNDVKETVAKLFEKRGQPHMQPGNKWFRLFLNRHPNLTQRHAEIISKARAAVTEGSIRKWFSDLTQYLDEQNDGGIMDCPERIFNLDETGVQLCPKTGLVLAPKNYRAMYTLASGQEKQCVTVLCNFSASGGIVPPFVVYPLQRISKEIAQSVPDDWGIGRSDSGWMTSSTFLEYIKEIFFPWLQANDIELPVILFVDGHKSHVSMQLHEFSVEKKIIIYCLHPNTTHILQPCDVGIFGPLKAAWKNAVRKHKLKENVQLTRSNFVKVFAQAFEKSVTQNVIQSGFKACGLYPLNPNAVDYTKCISNRKEEISKNITVQDYTTTISVIEKTVSKKTLDKYNDLRSENNKIKSTLFQFWNKCKNKVENMTSTQSHIEDDNSALNVPRSENSNIVGTTSANTQTCHEEDLSMTLGIDSIVEGLLNIEDMPIDIEGCNVLMDDASFIGDIDIQKNISDISNLNNDIDGRNLAASLIKDQDNQKDTDAPLIGNEDNQNDTIETANLNYDTERRNDLLNNMTMDNQNDFTDTSTLMEPVTTSTPVINKPAIPLPWHTNIEDKSNDSLYEKPSDIVVNVSDLFKLPEEKKTVKRKLSASSAMPLAITSKKFKEYLNDKESEKRRKTEEIKQRKIEREQKKAEKENIAKEKKSKVKTSEPRLRKDKKTLVSLQTETLHEVEISHASSASNIITPKQDKNTKRKTDSKNPDLSNIDDGTYVVVEFKTNRRNRYYAGVVVECDLVTDFRKIKFLRKKYSKLDNLVYFVEPSTVDVTEVTITDVKIVLPAPQVGRRGMLYFIEPDFDLNLCE